MKLRKLLVLSSAFACALSLASCGEKEESPKEEGTKVQVGLGYSAEYADGTATVNAAFVAFDGDKVVDARIDAVQVKIKATDAEKGCIALNGTVGETGYVLSKLELGTNYNMVKFGGAIAEVDAQIEAYADWTVGKTVSAITSGLKARDDGHYDGNVYTSDDALWAKCTISVDSFAAAVKSAYDNRTGKEYTVKNAKAGIALAGNISEATHGAGYDQVSVDMGGALVENGKVVAAAIDAVTFSFKADETNGFAENKTTKYYDQTSGAILSKKVLGDAYAMADRNHPAYSNGCTLEWFEQAANIEKGVEGKTATEIKALTEISGATITISAYVNALARAAEYAVKEHVGPQAA